LGHASRFVEQGAWRIASASTPGGIETVAFLNPGGTRVLLAFNAGAAGQAFAVEADGRRFAYTLAAGAAVTFRWRAPR
ncbi:glycoside hydrolase family 30 beta sandwich domain-containing protein, partial [Acinetobacter baumannii]